jgi:hypothetical protein
MEDHEQGATGQVVRHRKSLDDQQRFVAYVAMHFQCMKNGGKFKKGTRKT